MEMTLALNEDAEANALGSLLDGGLAPFAGLLTPHLTSPLVAALQMQQERIQGLIHDMSDSLTFLLNALEFFRFSPQGQPPEEVLAHLQHEAERISSDIELLEEAVLDTLGWHAPEDTQSNCVGRVLWAMERPAHGGLNKAIRSALGEGVFLRTVDSVDLALEELGREGFQLLITGYNLRGGTGFDLVRALRQETGWVSAVMATAQGNELVAARCIQEGFQAYLSSRMLEKPELVQETLRKALGQGTHMRRLACSMRQMVEMALRDGLTLLYNRFFIEQLLLMEINRSRRYGHPFCVALVDLDGFKAVNDIMGHHRGDMVLREVACLLKKNLRSTDHIGRYGGDEFLIILPQADLESGLSLCHRIVSEVAIHVFPDRIPGAPITLSVGLTHWRANGALTAARILEEADHALYNAKNGGKNRIWHFPGP